LGFLPEEAIMSNQTTIREKVVREWELTDNSVRSKRDPWCATPLTLAERHFLEVTVFNPNRPAPIPRGGLIKNAKETLARRGIVPKVV
jgi:hypothetical protein